MNMTKNLKLKIGSPRANGARADCWMEFQMISESEPEQSECGISDKPVAPSTVTGLQQAQRQIQRHELEFHFDLTWHPIFIKCSCGKEFTVREQ